MNFLLRHKPVLTYDVDLWIDDAEENLRRAEVALGDLRAEWGATDDDWRPVAARPAGWLRTQGVFCLTSPHGAIDIFRTVRGLDDWHACDRRASNERTAAGVGYKGLADSDMLACQLALDESVRNHERVRALRDALKRSSGD